MILIAWKFEDQTARPLQVAIVVILFCFCLESREKEDFSKGWNFCSGWVEWSKLQSPPNALSSTGSDPRRETIAAHVDGKVFKAFRTTERNDNLTAKANLNLKAQFKHSFSVNFVRFFELSFDILDSILSPLLAELAWNARTATPSTRRYGEETLKASPFATLAGFTTNCTMLIAQSQWRKNKFRWVTDDLKVNWKLIFIFFLRRENASLRAWKTQTEPQQSHRKTHLWVLLVRLINHSQMFNYKFDCFIRIPFGHKRINSKEQKHKKLDAL